MTAVASFIFVLLFALILLARRALEGYSRSRLERYCQSQRLDLYREIVDQEEATLLALHALGWLALVAIAVCVWRLGGGVSDGIIRWGILFLCWLGLLAVDLWVGRPFGQRFAEAIVVRSWRILRVARALLTPVLLVAQAAERLVEAMFGPPDDAGVSPIQEELLSFVEDVEREGALKEDAADMIEGLIELSEISVQEAMTPRTEMVMLRCDASLEEAAGVISSSGHSRIPVYSENRDEILGVLYAKDLLPYLGKVPANFSLRRLKLRRPVYVPESKPVDVLLGEFRKERIHIAIVLDEYGGVAGLVTIEDILELIVGDIEDEHDPAEAPPIQFLEGGELEVDARTRLDELNEVARMNLPETEDYDTIGGYVFNTIGRIPKAGESFTQDGITFTVVAASDRTVERVRIDLNQRQAAPAAPDGAASAS